MERMLSSNDAVVNPTSCLEQPKSANLAMPASVTNTFAPAYTLQIKILQLMLHSIIIEITLNVSMYNSFSVKILHATKHLSYKSTTITMN